MPALPGAQKISTGSCEVLLRAQTIACSRPPDPIINILFMDRVPDAATQQETCQGGPVLSGFTLTQFRHRFIPVVKVAASQAGTFTLIGKNRRAYSFERFFLIARRHHVF